VIVWSESGLAHSKGKSTKEESVCVCVCVCVWKVAVLFQVSLSFGSKSGKDV
jgi:hypothetical protein